MATTTAIVTVEGLALTTDVMERFDLRPGDEVTVSITSHAVRPLPAEVEHLINEIPGMLGGPYGLAEELMRERREEYKHSKW